MTTGTQTVEPRVELVLLRENASFPRIHHPDPHLAELLSEQVSEPAKEFFAPEWANGECSVLANPRVVSVLCTSDSPPPEIDQDHASPYYGQAIGGAPSARRMLVVNRIIDRETLRPLALREILRPGLTVEAALSRLIEKGDEFARLRWCKPASAEFVFEPAPQHGLLVACDGAVVRVPPEDVGALISGEFVEAAALDALSFP